MLPQFRKPFLFFVTLFVSIAAAHGAAFTPNVMAPLSVGDLSNPNGSASANDWQLFQSELQQMFGGARSKAARTVSSIGPTTTKSQVRSSLPVFNGSLSFRFINAVETLATLATFRSLLGFGQSTLANKEFSRATI